MLKTLKTAAILALVLPLPALALEDIKRNDALLDQSLDELATSLRKLRGVAEDMREEVDYQNHLLDDLNNKAEDTEHELKKQNKSLKDLKEEEDCGCCSICCSIS